MGGSMRSRSLVLSLSLVLIAISVAAPALAKPPTPDDTEVTWRTSIQTIGDDRPEPGDAPIGRDRSAVERKGDKMRASLARRNIPDPPLPSGASVLADDFYTVSQCRALLPGNGTVHKYKNNRTSCMASRREVITYRCTGDTCTKVGSRLFRLVMITFLGHGSGNVKMTSQISVDQWGAPIGTSLNGNMFVEMRCKYADLAENLCSAQTPASRIVSMPINLWVGNGGAVYGQEFKLASYPGRGPDLTHFHELELWNGITGTGRNDAPKEGPNEQIRCNKLVYNVPEGCIILTVQSVFHVKRSSTPESAEHIRLACYGPGVGDIVRFADYVEVRDGTVPWKNGGRIAGQKDCNTSGLPLERNVHNTGLRSGSLAKAQAACRDTWGANYPSQKGEPNNWQCDEYPFNSTYQASASSLHNTTASWWSARVIHKQDNERLGGQLSAWYSADHVLHEDPFWVQIDD